MSVYKTYNADQLEELFSRFFISVWSYSGVSTFARNQKAFEKEYIYREWSKQSASTIAGKAYHEALRLFFENLQRGVGTSIVEMETAAYNLIDKVRPDEWKIQKTTPSISDCVVSATKIANALIANFDREKGIYTDEIAEVLAVEEQCVEWLTVNGVDIPLPCKSFQDLVVRLTSGKVVIIDHKSKSSFTNDEDLAFTSAIQAIVYAKSVGAKMGITVDEVWFMENKYSTNKDGSPQIKQFRITLDKDTRMLYEALLYEPLKLMIEAVSDPDHVYIINNSDNLTDKAELFEFWTRTLISEVDEFNIPEAKKDMMAKRQKKIRNASVAAINPNVISKFKKNASQFIAYDLTHTDMTNGEKIEHRLRSFSIPVEVRYEIEGYSSNTYLLEVSAGTKIASVLRYKLDIANALNVPAVRMDEKLVVHEGRAYLPIEVSKKRTKDLFFDEKYLDGERIPIGVDNFGKTIVWDLNNTSTPHVLICGATGSGKSVSIISIIQSAKRVGIDDIIIFDPKREFTQYARDGFKVFYDIEEIEIQMMILVDEMKARVKNGWDGRKTLVIFDEFADAVISAESGKDLEQNLRMLLQKGRSLGFRIVAATQRASTKIITGDAKVNFPVQICFRVPKEIDSKVVLDEAGAETLAGYGDGLMRSPEYIETVRFQGFYYNK